RASLEEVKHRRRDDIPIVQAQERVEAIDLNPFQTKHRLDWICLHLNAVCTREFDQRLIARVFVGQQRNIRRRVARSEKLLDGENRRGVVSGDEDFMFHSSPFNRITNAVSRLTTVSYP